MSIRHLALCVVVLSAVSGCGDGRPTLVKPVGKVTLDGQPLEGALVSLQPIPDPSLKGFARPANATTDATGGFVPGTYGTGDGLPRENTGSESSNVKSSANCPRTTTPNRRNVLM